MTSSSGLVTYFMTFMFIGAIGNLLLLILVTLNRRRLVRHPTWYGFCFAWVLYSITYLL